MVVALSPDQREEIRRRAAAGEGGAAIAAAIGCGRSTVWRILQEARKPRSSPPPAAAEGAAIAAAEVEGAGGPAATRRVPPKHPPLPGDAELDQVRDEVRVALVEQVSRLRAHIDRIDAAIEFELVQGELGAELRPSRVRELTWSRATLQDKLGHALERIAAIDEAKPKQKRPRAVFRPKVVALQTGEAPPAADSEAG